MLLALTLYVVLVAIPLTAIATTVIVAVTGRSGVAIAVGAVNLVVLAGFPTFVRLLDAELADRPGATGEYLEGLPTAIAMVVSLITAIMFTSIVAVASRRTHREG